MSNIQNIKSMIHVITKKENVSMIEYKKEKRIREEGVKEERRKEKRGNWREGTGKIGKRRKGEKLFPLTNS